MRWEGGEIAIIQFFKRSMYFTLGFPLPCHCAPGCRCENYPGVNKIAYTDAVNNSSRGLMVGRLE